MDISISIPGIRTHNWNQLIDSIQKSCQNYTWEAIFAGPFDPPTELATKHNIHYIKTYAQPSTACQMATAQTTGKMHFIGVDDAIFIPNSIDELINQYDTLNNPKAIITMRYKEGPGHSGYTQPEQYWTVAGHLPELDMCGLPKHYKICITPFMSTASYIELGGINCEYEFMNFALHDFCYRAQYAGFEIHHSTTDSFSCDHMPGGGGDHYAIEESHFPDYEVLKNKYNNPDALNLNTIKIPFDNWKNHIEPWDRRFSTKLFTNYNDMISTVVPTISWEERIATRKKSRNGQRNRTTKR